MTATFQFKWATSSGKIGFSTSFEVLKVMQETGRGMRNKTLWATTLVFAVSAIIQPTWDWLIANVLDKVASNPGWIIGRISHVVALIAPFQPYLVGIAVGLLMAALLSGSRRFLESREDSRKHELWELGQSALNKADSIAGWQRNPFLFNDHGAYLMEVYALLLRFRKAGFPFPEVPTDAPSEEKLEIARRYFLMVGNLLAGGHEIEARQAAVETCQIAHSDAGFEKEFR